MEVGQDVYVVPRETRDRPYAATVAKVSRKWVTLEPSYAGRFDKETGEVDGGRDYGPRGDVWQSKDAYEKYRAMSTKWDAMRLSIPFQVPEHLSEFDLDLISDLINGN